MKTRSAKNKGMRLQKWVCEKISEALNIPFNNQDEQSEIHSRECGLSGVDIILRGDAFKNFPYDIEAKNTESVSLYKWIEQAKSNTKANREWLVVHKKNKSNPIVIMDANHFFSLIKQLKEKKND